MNVEYKEKIEKLKKHVKMENPEDIELFEKLVWELAETEDAEVLGELIDLFDDNCPFLEVMYSLVHAIEITPKEIYVPLLMNKISAGLTNYPFWLECLFNRIFNDSTYLKIFESNLNIISKSELYDILEIMKQESPHHIKLINQIKYQNDMTLQ